MIRLHEILKIVNDLQDQDQLELSHRIAGIYMDRLDSMELRFFHLTTAVKLGFIDQALDQLGASLETNQWFSLWFLQRTPELQPLNAWPRYQAFLKSCELKEMEYWQSGAASPIIQVPDSKPPYPLIIALHGNGFNARHSAMHWADAVKGGWLLFHPLAKRLVGYDTHWWDNHEENRVIITEQAEKYLKPYVIDPERVILGGFSKGGETAMVLALGGKFGAKGFITIGAGGYFHIQPDLWEPLLKSNPQGLRGVAMYSPYDLERAEGPNRTMEMFQAAGIEIRIDKYYAEGHVFPEDFAIHFQRAVDFISGSDPV